MKSYKLRAEKIENRVQELSKCSDEKNYISRLFGTKAFMDCRDKIEMWMKEAGLQTRVDSIGNVRGKIVSDNTKARTFVIASHYDTVINAGKYDGTLGVLMGLDVMEKLITNGIKLPFNIELIAVSDGEGVRFHSSHLGSKVVTGNFNPDFLELTDDHGITLRNTLQQLNYDEQRLSQDAIAPGEWLGYYEIHIEQGPFLYKHDIAAAVVTGIAGQKKISIEFNGISGHAGTTPMHMRKDALAAAAEFVVAVEKFASSKKSETVATVGTIEVEHPASNIIPGKVLCSLDIRSSNKKKLSRAYEGLYELCEELCNNRKVYFQWTLQQETDPILLDEKLIKHLRKAIKEKDIEVIEIQSGAGHDAVPVSRVAPVVMLLVKCFKGISHNPLENVDIKDIADALEISDNFIQLLIQSPKIVEL
jgi:allantoate deiminase